MIIRYDSPAAVARDYVARRCSPFGASLSWYGNETTDETLRKAEIGDTSLVTAAEEAMSKIEMQIETPRRVWERSPAGPWCSVPDYLAGLPTPMRRMVHSNEETNPVTILFDTASSASVPADVFMKRGVTILALTMALARVRPVALWQMDNGNGVDASGETVVMSQINTAPLDLATACYVMTSIAFARRLCYSLETKLNGFSGGWAKGYDHGNPMRYYNGLLQRMGFDAAHTLVIPGAHIRDELVTQPIEWINRQVARFTENLEEVDNA